MFYQYNILMRTGRGGGCAITAGGRNVRPLVNRNISSLSDDESRRGRRRGSMPTLLNTTSSLATGGNMQQPLNTMHASTTSMHILAGRLDATVLCSIVGSSLFWICYDMHVVCFLSSACNACIVAKTYVVRGRR